MLINETNLAGLYTGFKGNFNKGYEGAETAYSRIAMKVPSNTREETYGWLGQIPKLREWVGDRHLKQLTAHSYTLKNKGFEDTIEVQKDDIEDDQYGIFAPLFEEMGRAAAELPDELIFGLLRDGFSTPCYDGKSFFAVDHQVDVASGQPASVSNMQAGSEEPWFLLDTRKAIKPLIFQERRPFNNLVKLDRDDHRDVFFRKKYIYGIDGRGNAGFGLWQLAFGSKDELTPENYASARAAMQTLRGDEGRRLNIKPDVLVCGPNLEEQALTLLNTDLISGGESNPWKGTATPIITAWADPD